MIISQEDIEKVKKNESKFVSLKYIDLHGNLLQLDMYCHHFISGNNNLAGKPIKLIPDKAFSDPFRSFPTTSFLCENMEDNLNVRTNAHHLINQHNLDHYQNISAFIHFWIESKEQAETGELSSLLIADPVDKYANLRSDIIDCLENMGIRTSLHYHGFEFNECVIGIEGNNILDLADNIIIGKFVIANVARSYGQNVTFNNKNNHNMELNISLTQNLLEQFSHNISNNSDKIASLFLPATSDLLNINLVRQDNEKNLKVLLKAGKTFNSYLAITSLIGYCIIKNFSANQFFSDTVLNNYKTTN